ncbi:unnamed protein product [Anisakis simplex]|uniref:Pecanex-like protein n=1 Tax=Anisakis simplex TaxID=6269 RepID=A0A0M3JFF6_ANISI|nr:unnamed protein product [Anisakis simplex]
MGASPIPVMDSGFVDTVARWRELAKSVVMKVRSLPLSNRTDTVWLYLVLRLTTSIAVHINKTVFSDWLESFCIAVIAWIVTLSLLLDWGALIVAWTVEFPAAFLLSLHIAELWESLLQW